MNKTWANDKLDLFKKDLASNFLYPKRFSYADTDAVSWKSHITKDFEKKMPDYYGIGTIKRAKDEAMYYPPPPPERELMRTINNRSVAKFHEKDMQNLKSFVPENQLNAAKNYTFKSTDSFLERYEEPERPRYQIPNNIDSARYTTLENEYTSVRSKNNNATIDPNVFKNLRNISSL
mmetsp:Transcript_13297/g.11776  ORF Transcript_13297/g.11776 Transcript_13297/m.11776 type:complete len:177 (+) Transcript_13297:210-740(+)